MASLILPLSTACGRRDRNAEQKVNILRYGNGAEPKDLDPHIVTGLVEFNIIQSLLEGLVTLDPNTLQPIPAAAASWDISADQLTYTFHLQPTGRWSNGEPVTAEDFVYSWRRLLDPKTAAEYAYMAWYVKNAKEYTEGKIKDPSLVGVTAPDSLTFVVTLKAPTPFFMPLLNHHSLYPVPRAQIEKFGAQWTRPENFVGNGAFQLKRWELNKVIEVARNPHYWDASTVKLDGIQFFPIEDQGTEEKTYRDGRLDLTSTLPTERIAAWRGKPDFHNFPTLGTYYYEINVKRGPLKDPRVRRALAMSIDRQMIVDHVTRGGQIPAFAYTPPNTAGFTAKAQIKFDPEAARKLLADAGFPGGKGFPKIDILYNTSEGHKQIAEALQQMWKKELGIELGLFNQEWKVFLNTKKKLDFEIARAGWHGDYPDANTFLDMYVTGGGNNNTGWSNKEYDELIEKASMTPDRESRYGYFQRCEELLVEECPIIPIYVYTRVHLISPRVKGITENVLDFVPYKYISLE